MGVSFRKHSSSGKESWSVSRPESTFTFQDRFCQASPGQANGLGQTFALQRPQWAPGTCSGVFATANESTQVAASLPKEREGTPTHITPSTTTSSREALPSLLLSVRAPLFARRPLAWVMKKSKLMYSGALVNLYLFSGNRCTLIRPRVLLPVLQKTTPYHRSFSPLHGRYTEPTKEADVLLAVQFRTEIVFVFK